MQLLDVQRAAKEAAKDKPGFAFFMEQGLGKTSTYLSEFEDHVEQDYVSRSVVIAPNSFKGGWRFEIEKQGFNIEPFIWTPDREDAFNHWMRRGFIKPPMLIVNYEATRYERVRELIYRFMRERPTSLVFDESIQLKQFDSLQTKAGIEISKDAAVNRVLSGKPMTQGPHDLWAQMRVIKEQEGREFYAWKTLFCKRGGFKGKQIVGAQNQDYMAKLINPVTFWATKKDWTDLPPKLYTHREYTLTSEMAAQYKSMEDQFVLWLSETEAVTIDAAITKYIKLAQIQCGWVYDEEGKPRPLVSRDRNPRLKLLKQIIDEEVTGKTIVVYRHKPVLDQLLEEFAKYNPAWIKGGMTPDETERQKARFNSDNNCRVLFNQTEAGKYGHTLLGGPEPENHCCTCIFYENTYSLDGRGQLEDRNHRHGQLGDSVLYIDLVATSLDFRMIRALQLKEDIFQSVFAEMTRTSAADWR